MGYRDSDIVIQQRRNKRYIRGILSIKVNSEDITIKLNFIFPTPYENNKNLGPAKSINEDTRLFARSIGTEILKILKDYKFKIK